MNVQSPPRMTVDEFLRWSASQDRGRYELEEGRVVAMPSENLGHTDTKRLVYEAFASAILRAATACYAMPDGPTVRISDDRAYEPDALIAPLPKPPRTALEIPQPIVVAEVLSPTAGSARLDLTTKLSGYAMVASIAHYIVVDPEERVVIHFHRQGSLLVHGGELRDGVLRLDPPGLDVRVADMLLPPEHEATARS